MILVASSNDYANLGHEIGKALRSVGVDCEDVAIHSHPFNYKSQSRQVRLNDLKVLISKSDLVVIMHSDPVLLNYVGNKPYVVYHTGTRYRSNPEYNDRMFKRAVLALTDQTEFIVINKALKYVVCPVELSPAKYYKSGTLKFAHYPSNPEVKGSNEVNAMITKFLDRVKYSYSSHKVNHKDQLERMARCDVYIELFKPILNGKEYGCFGVTALEAASLGKIVITNNIYPEIYEDVYGKAPFTIANTKDQFMNVVQGIINLPEGMVREIQKDSAKIAHENHSYKSTGNLLKSYLNV